MKVSMSDNLLISQYGWDFEGEIDHDMLSDLEKAARTCYKSEDKIRNGSAVKLIRHCIERGHDSVLEHKSISVRIFTDIGVARELTRHRHASFSQESTRYVKYDKLKVIPPFHVRGNPSLMAVWRNAMSHCFSAYAIMLTGGASPQMARSVLPLSTATELVMTCNLREWRHVFKLRCDKAAHPDMRFLMLNMLFYFNANIPVVFEDLFNLYRKEIEECLNLN